MSTFGLGFGSGAGTGAGAGAGVGVGLGVGVGAGSFGPFVFPSPDPFGGFCGVVPSCGGGFFFGLSSGDCPKLMAFADTREAASRMSRDFMI